LTAATASASCRFAASVFCEITAGRRNLRWVALYILGSHIISIRLSGHTGRHMHLGHIGCSWGGVNKGWAAGAHGWGALVGHRLTPSLILVLHDAAIGWRAE
jgi:hypothetical protein